MHSHRLLVSLLYDRGPARLRFRRSGCRSHIGCPPWCGSHLACAVPGVAAGQGVAQEGFAQLEVAMPSQLDEPVGPSNGGHVSPSERVVIGMDPHKRSATIEVMMSNETILGSGRFSTDRDGYTAMVKYAEQWTTRVRAIEGCQGIGRHIATRLLADGEQIVDVPPKLSARARVFATGQGRKTDATDAHSVALVGTRMAGLHPLVT